VTFVEGAWRVYVFYCLNTITQEVCPGGFPREGAYGRNPKPEVNPTPCLRRGFADILHQAMHTPPT
jgi:hypothetical protein